MASPLPTKTAAEVREDILRAIRNLRPEAPLSADDDEVIRASAVGVAIEAAYVHQQWVLRQFFPQTADWEYLLMHAAALAGMTPKLATVASGTVTASGNEGAAIPAGQQLTLAGVTWTSVAAAVIDASGSVSVSVQATAAGEAGNLLPGTTLGWISAPAGVLSEVQVVSIGGGTDAEDTEALRARLMFALQNPEGQGGTDDLKRWALEVDGVTGAYVFPRRRGLGSCDICIVSASGLPSQALIDEVLAYIESKAVVQGDRIVFAPQVNTIDFVIEVQLDDITLAAAEQQVNDLLVLYFSLFAPGDGLVKRQLEARILDIQGVTDVNITTPAANVSAVINNQVVQWLQLGTVAVSEMLP